MNRTITHKNKQFRCAYLRLTVLLLLSIGYAQQDQDRIQNIRDQLTLMAVENTGLNEVFKTNIQATNITLGNLLLAVAEVHKLNIIPDQNLKQQTLSPSFPNVVVTDLLVFLCKNYNLTIDFTGNILAVKPYKKPQEIPEERIIPIHYNPSTNTITIDAKNDNLYKVFKRVMDQSAKNLVFQPGLENKSITAYLKDVQFDIAMDKLAFSNNLYVEKTNDGFYRFEDDGQNASIGPSNTSNQNTVRQRPRRSRNSNLFFEVKDLEKKRLEVDFVNASIADIINDISQELQINIFTATPLDQAGTVSFKSKTITFDDLLTKIFEVQTLSGQANNGIDRTKNLGAMASTSPLGKQFSFKKEGDVYFFGTTDQLSIRNIEIIHLQYRSVELLADPSGQSGGVGFGNSGLNNSFGNTQFNNITNQNSQQQNQSSFNNRNTNQNIITPRNTNFGNNQSSDLLSIIPDEILQNLDIKIDTELNSFYVTGPSTNIERFKAFIKDIDKPVPVVLIEVMIVEVSRSNTTDTGVEWGIGSEPAITQGNIFPSADLTLSANTVNRIIGGFDDFLGFNLGQVGPNFFATIRAMETNGNFKILSTPKLATLNGHRASFSNGQQSYYAVTQTNIIGSQNPQTTEITNYLPIQAQLALDIKPSVSGDGEVLLDISVIQSSFGTRIANDAPPDLNSRNFNSIIRMRDQDIAILGGLEETTKSNSGSGVPFLARIPLIKYLFSRRVREARKSKLSVLIKPIIIK